MKVLVTGATGFLGRHVCRVLVEQGHQVQAMSRGGTQLPGTVAVVGDVLDPDSLAVAVEGCTHVVHAAGRVSNDPADARALFELHVRGTRFLLDAAKAAGIQKVVVLSTSGTVAISEDAAVASEDSETPMHLIQQWPYYRSKLFAEEVALAASSDDMPVVALNPSLILGPGDVTGESTKAVRLFLEDKVPVSPRGGVSFVDVRDVAQAVVAAFEHGRGGERYLLGGANMSFESFYRRLGQVADKPYPLLRAPGVTKRLFEMFPKWGREDVGFGFGVDRVGLLQASHFWYLDDQKARDELHFETRDPNITLRDTCADILYGASRFAPPERQGL